MLINSNVVEVLISRLGDKDILRPIDLVKAGIFGSFGGAKRAIDLGRIPSIQIGPRRVLISKKDVISYLLKCEHNKEKGTEI